MMNQNHLFPNGSPSSIIDSIQINNSNAPLHMKAPSSLTKDYTSTFQQSPSTQHTYSSVDGNSNSNSIKAKGFGVNDNNYKITTQLVDSIMPTNYSGSAQSPITSQFPSYSQSQSGGQSYFSNQSTATTTPFQINSLLSMTNTNIGGSVSTSGESPHPEANKQKLPITFNQQNSDSKIQSGVGGSAVPASSLSQFFKNQGYSFSTVTSPQANQQPLQSLSFHHQASYQGNSNSIQSSKIPIAANQNIQKNDFVSQYSKEGTTTNLQQQNHSPYSINVIGESYNNNQYKTDLITQQLKEVQKVQQQLANIGISSQQQYSNLGGSQQPYLGSNISSLSTPQRDLYSNGLSQSFLEQSNTANNNLAATTLNKIYSQGTASQSDDKQAHQETNGQSYATPTAEQLINKYYLLRQNSLQSNNNNPQINTPQQTQSQQQADNKSYYQQPPLQSNNYANQATSHFQSLPSLVPGQVPFGAQPSNSSFAQNTQPPSYQIPKQNESLISKKYENLVPTATITTPMRKESAPVVESYQIGGIQKNQNEVNTANITNIASPTQKHINYKYQSFDQNSIQKALSGLSQQNNSIPTSNQTFQSPQGANQASINATAINTSPTSSLNQNAYNLNQILSPTSGSYKQSISDDMPFQATSPYLGNHIISVQKPYIQGHNNTQNNSLSSGGMSSNRQSEADNLTGLNDSILQGGGSGGIGVQKIPSLSVQSNDLSNQFRNTQGFQNEDQGVQKQQQFPQSNQTKDVFSLYQTIMQGGIPKAQIITNNASFPSPSQGFGINNQKEPNDESQQPSSARGSNPTSPYIASSLPSSQSAQKVPQQQIFYKITPPSIPQSQTQNYQTNSQNIPQPGQQQSPQSQVKPSYQVTNNLKPQQQQPLQQQLPYIPKIQQSQKQLFESGQPTNQIGNRPRGAYTVVDSQSHPYITYKNPKQSTNYKQKIWQNILNQRKNKMNSFHSPVREKSFYGNNLNASADDFSRGNPPQFSPQKKPSQQGLPPNGQMNLNGQQPGLQIGYNQYGQPINCIANSKFGKLQNQEQQQQVQYITFVNQNGQKVEQKVLIKAPNNQQYNMNNASFPNPTFGMEQKPQGYLEQYSSNRQSEETPKINLEIVNNHSAPNENIFYGDQKAMTFSKVSGNSTNSQNSGQNSPAFINNQTQKSHSPSGKKPPSSQFAVSHDQQDLTKRNLKYEQPDSVIGVGSTDVGLKDQKINGAIKENLNRAMRMSFGGESSNENKTVKI